MIKRKKRILAEGEVTGHSHKVNVDVFDDENVGYFKGKTDVEHEEHKTVSVPEDEYNFGIVREFDPFEEMERLVKD